MAKKKAKKKAKKVAKKAAKKVVAKKKAVKKAKKVAEKESPMVTVGTVMLLKSLYKRARKIGMTDNQIKAQSDAAAVKAFCDQLHPASNPGAKPKPGVVPPPVEYDDNIPDKIDFVSTFEVTFSSSARIQTDESNLQNELMRINRKYGTHDPIRILMDRDMHIVDGKNKAEQNAKVLITKYVIIYTE